ncbi:MAG: GIY-YIG nuclease family protein [Acidobacteria bacterium]|nr:GIY-YIG nuclease family protein [Acidobacteriota bacterium]
MTAYARMWPREIFDGRKGREVLARPVEFLKHPGVYVLYRDEHPYYIGKTSISLFQRIRAHATNPHDRYYNFWNLFSAFAVPDQVKRNELEGILIAAMPAVNNAQPKLTKMRLPRNIADFMAKMRQSKVSAATLKEAKVGKRK